MKTKLDQDQAIALRDALLLSATNLAAAIEARTGEKIALPTLSGESSGLMEDVTALEAHCGFLRSRLPTPAKPAAVIPPAQTATTATVTAAKTASGKKPTSTERVLAARGVKTLAELTPAVNQN